jgi:hypothetical protein
LLRFGLALCGMVALACDYGLEVRGTVVDPNGGPVGQANFVIEDRLPDRGWRDQGLTDEAGRFESSITIGEVEHDFWVTVTKESFQEHSTRVWKGDGHPERPIELEIILVPE